MAAGSHDTALKLCQEISSRAPKALWAWQGLGRLLLDQGRPEAALMPLQAALRLNPKASPTWEALGAAYHKLGRLTAALKVGLAIDFSQHGHEACACMPPMSRSGLRKGHSTRVVVTRLAAHR